MTRPDIPEEVVDRLRRAEHLVVFTGAGVSAESGIPTFRDAMTGLWERFRPEELATPEAFRADPDTVWRWYAWRRSLLEGCRPNPAHRAIARLETLVPRLSLVTQNVDGLHQKAGSGSVVELHGNLARDRCFESCGEVLEPGSREDRPPTCARCGELMRPDVVWFGEILPAGALTAAFEAARRCDVLLSVGTSGMVEPAASVPRIARAAGAAVIVVNPDAGPPSDVYALRGRAGEVLPEIVRQIEG